MTEVQIPTDEPVEDAPTPHRYTKPFDQWRHLPEWKRQFFEDMPEWKCEWFSRLDRRDCEQIFPSEEVSIQQWEADRRFVQTLRRMTSKIGGLVGTGVVGAVVVGFLTIVTLGIQAYVGKH